MEEKFVGQLKKIDRSNSIDLLDRKILYLLGINARFSLSLIAKTLDKRVDIIKYRIGTMEKKGMISGYFSYINMQKLGFRSHIIMLKFRNFKNFDSIIKEIIEIPDVYQLQKCGGQWDLRLYIHTLDNEEYKEVMAKIIQITQNSLMDYTIMENIDQRFRSLGFVIEERLVPKLKRNVRINKSSFFSEMNKIKDAKLQLDTKDIKIIGEIALNARLSIKDLSEKIGLAEPAVMNRLSNLVSHDYIQRFVPFIPYQNYGIQWFKILLKIKSNAEDKAMAFISKLPEVPQTIKMIGDYNIQASIFVRNLDDLYSTLNNIRTILDDELLSYQILFIFDQLKHKVVFEKLDRIYT